MQYSKYPDSEATNYSKITYGYDGGNPPRLTSMKYYFGTTFLHGVKWTFDDYARVNQLTKTDSAGNALTHNGQPVTNDYRFDDEGRQDQYERFSNLYTIAYSDQSDPHVEKIVAAPDGSKTIETSWVASGVLIAGVTITENTTSDNGDQITRYKKLTDTATGNLVGYKNGLNQTTTYSYANNLLDRITQPLSNYTQYTYDASNRATRISEKTNGGVETAYVQYDYDDEDRNTKTYTSTLSETSRLYTDDLLTRITDGENRKTYFNYNGDEQLVAVGDGSATTTFTYDSEERRDLVTSPRGIQTKYMYHPQSGNLWKVYNDYSGAQPMTEYKYDQSGYGDKLTEVLDATGRKTTYTYDNWDRLQDEKIWNGANLGGHTYYRYDDSMGEYLKSKTVVLDANNRNKTIFDYYAPGFLKQQAWHRFINGATEAQDWGSVSYTYDGAGRLSTAVPSSGDCSSCNVTKVYTYDNNGQLLSHTATQQEGVTSPPALITYEYDGISRLDKVNIPSHLGTSLNTVDYGYDVANRITSVNPTSTNNDITLAYNKANQLTDIGFAGCDVTNTYDSVSGRLNQIYLLDAETNGQTVDYGYNSDGLRTSARYNSSRKVFYGYDNLNRLTAETGHNPSSGTCITLSSGQSVSIAQNGDLSLPSGSTDFVVDMRIKLTSYPASEAVLFERGISTSNNYFRLLLTTAGYLKAQVRNAGSVVTLTSTSYPVPLGVWCHVAGAFKQNNSHGLRVLRNGFEIAYTATAAGNLGQYSNASPKIGGGGFAGKIDEVHVRNAFPASWTIEGSNTTGGSTLGLWHFNTGSGTTEADDDSDAQTATVPAGSWTNATGEFYPARYEFYYTYDSVGNRTAMSIFKRTATPTSEKWTFNYNGMNQLTDRSWKLTDGSDTLQYKWLYTYDGAGNLKTAEYQNAAAVKQLKWVYTWNPRGQMTLAEKFSGTNDAYAGKVAYIYCLTCDGALSQRVEYSPTVSTTITSWKRYEYDGLNLLRVDERYDDDVPTNGIDDQDPWRKKEVSTHKPGSLANLLGKMVYIYTGANLNTDTPSASYFYAYFYDAVGNLLWTVDNSGYLNYTFSQDAFGNELSVSPFSGNPWSSARTYCTNEHQTGKWIDPFTGLYFFHARWYDSTVGRWISRDPGGSKGGETYGFVESCPTSLVDRDGFEPGPPDQSDPITPCPSCTNGQLPDLVGLLCGPYRCSPAGIDLWSRALLGWFDQWKKGISPEMGNSKLRHYAANSLRHCVWQCVLGKQCGDTVARLTAWWHELGPILNYNDYFADMWNNARGREAGQAVQCSSDCYSACHDMLSNGTLIWDRDHDLRNEPGLW